MVANLSKQSLPEANIKKNKEPEVISAKEVSNHFITDVQHHHVDPRSNSTTKETCTIAAVSTKIFKSGELTTQRMEN